MRSSLSAAPIMRAPLLLGLLGSSLLGAADDAVRLHDLRLVGGLSPNDYESDGQRLDTHLPLRFAALYMAGWTPLQPVGWIGGVELSSTIARGESGPGSLGPDLDTLALTVHAGGAFLWPRENRVHLEGTAFFGLGRTRTELVGDDEEDGYLEYGPRLAAAYTFDDGWQLGVDLRWLFTTADEIENDGIAAFVTAGFRF